ncbi:MAG: hypothetical protein JWO40_393 [Candidatus Doudnabacteria bacterium]|nr:hypothetical protein [Candidatus Doudnabacteria bacterium]
MKNQSSEITESGLALLAAEAAAANKTHVEAIGQILQEASDELDLLSAEVRAAEENVEKIEKETINQIDSALLDFISDSDLEI